MLSIAGYCRITDRECRLNGETVAERSAGQDTRGFLGTIYRSLQTDYPKFFKMDLLSKAGFLAAELLLKDVPEAEKEQMGVVLANRSSSLETDCQFQQTIGEEYFPSPAVFVYTLPNIVIGEICIRHKITGENCFFVAPEFDGEFLCGYIRGMFTDSGTESVLAGWVECGADACDVYCLHVKRGTGTELNNETIYLQKNN